MKKQLLVDFLQISETLKLGKKHHQKKRKQCTHDEAHAAHKKKRQDKMSFSTRMTLCLLQENESLNQRSIAKTMNISAQAVSEIIKKLLEKELIDKQAGELNNENIITSTDEGKRVAQKIDKKMAILSDNIFRDFTEEEIDSFSYLLGKIEKNKDDLFKEIKEV